MNRLVYKVEQVEVWRRLLREDKLDINNTLQIINCDVSTSVKDHSVTINTMDV